MVHSTCFFLFAALFVSAYAINTCKSSTDCKVQGCGCQEGIFFGLSVCSPSGDIDPSQREKCKSCDKDSDCDFLGCTELPIPNRICNRCIADIVSKPLAKCTGVELNFCRKDSDCSGSCSCENLPEVPWGVCINAKKFESSLAKCTTCATDGDCPNSACLSTNTLLKRSICEDCQAKNTNMDVLQCGSGSGSAPCVSTSWLRRNGLADATIRHASSAPVLCIPGLPCGTHGHLLRDADSNLVSYREACEHRSDCVASAMPVSQLSHTFDWSSILSSDGELSLTSLSVNPDSKAWSPSLIISNIGDGMNKVGLGFICNTAALLSQRIRNVNIVRLFMQSF